jgi:hypothetical protein
MEVYDVQCDGRLPLCTSATLLLLSTVQPSKLRHGMDSTKSLAKTLPWKARMLSVVGQHRMGKVRQTEYGRPKHELGQLNPKSQSNHTIEYVG